jgi:hypothetical protein
MLREPPEKVSQEKITFDVRELEPLLSAPPTPMAPFEPCYITLKDGSKMVIREAKREEAPEMLKYVKQMIDVDHDFYDIVGVRIYAEILGWVVNRLKDPFQIVGLIDGEWVGFANGRLFKDGIAISLHSLALKRGLRIGAIMYYAKAQYAFETLGQKEWWATYESYNGFKRWGIGMAQPSYPWPEYQHELGGATVYYVRRSYWDNVVKKYLLDLVKGELVRPVPKELLKKNEKLVLPKEVTV